MPTAGLEQSCRFQVLPFMPILQRIINQLLRLLVVRERFPTCTPLLSLLPAHKPRLLSMLSTPRKRCQPSKKFLVDLLLNIENHEWLICTLGAWRSSLWGLGLLGDTSSAEVSFSVSEHHLKGCPNRPVRISALCEPN